MATKASRAAATTKTAKKAAASKAASKTAKTKTKTKAKTKTKRKTETKTKVKAETKMETKTTDTDAKRVAASKTTTKTTRATATARKAVTRAARSPARPKSVAAPIEPDVPSASAVLNDFQKRILSVLPGPTEPVISRHAVRARVNALPPGYHYEQLAINDGLTSLLDLGEAEGSLEKGCRRKRKA